MSRLLVIVFSVLGSSVFQLVFQKLFEDFALRWGQVISLIFALKIPLMRGAISLGRRSNKPIKRRLCIQLSNRLSRR
jgi:uncharacterized membrane protein YfbV (UPF0208 family)